MLLKTFAVSVAMLAAFAVAPVRAETPGVSESEIKVGATFPFSGPASPLSNTGRGLIAYVHSVNDRGGVNGRKINLITYDDAYTPPKAVEQTRKLIESDEVAFLFSPLGTPGIGATIKYVTAKKVPHLFVVSGNSAKFANLVTPLTTKRCGTFFAVTYLMVAPMPGVPSGLNRNATSSLSISLRVCSTALGGE